MRVDPNQAVEFSTECVLCQHQQVDLYDGSCEAKAELSDANSHFNRFCKSLDPNKCYILAIIPDDKDKDVFFTAREVAAQHGIHMQALIETPKSHLARWETYKIMKNAANADGGNNESD